MPEICRFFGIIIARFGDDYNPHNFNVRYGEYRCTETIKTRVVQGEVDTPTEWARSIAH